MTHALHIVAGHMVERASTATRCQVCGVSPFAVGKTAAKAYGPNFVDYHLLRDYSADHVCHGCVRVMGGRPGDDPPPLRTRSVVATPDRLELHKGTGELWRYLDAPLDEPHVVSWATTKKKHHLLRAGVSTAERMLIGSDEATIEYVPARDRLLLDVVRSMLSGPTGKGPFSRRSIVEGTYTTPQIQRYGADRWARHEAVVAIYRGRPLLELVAYAAPQTTSDTEEVDVIHEDDALAARLLGEIARGSAMRATDGKQFWGGVFAHRVRRFARLPLRDFVARLMLELDVSPHSDAAQSATHILSVLDEGRTAEVETSIRERSALVVALSYEHRKGKTR